MSHFQTTETEPGVFGIECCFTVYRAKFGHHPSFLPQDEEKGKRDGFNTKFWLLVLDNLTKTEADEKLEEYRSMYDTEIEKIENDDALWDTFPFRSSPVVYCK